MKKNLLFVSFLLGAVSWVLAQTCAPSDCDCASCAQKESGSFSLPALQGLNEQPAEPAAEHDAHAECEHDHGAHEGHDHGAEEYAKHDSAEEGHEDHAHGSDDGHDHGAHADGGLVLSDAMLEKVGIKIHRAEAGRIVRASVFPAEIKLNRDRAAAVSPYYPSLVRQVFAEIGDEVEKGDVLAVLENRETMAAYTVSAPLNGVVISKNLSIGESAAEDRVLYEVADLSSVWADISIFPKFQHLINKGMPVTLIAHDGHRADGRIKYISPIISHETRTLTARCVLEKADEDFTPGAFVRAKINVDTVEAQVLVAREAVQHLDGEAVVFVPGGEGFITAPVRLGLQDEHSVEIVGGLKVGDEYVAVGAFALKAQMVTSGMDPHAGHGH